MIATSLEEAEVRSLVLLGCGKMGSALLEGWLASGLPPEAVHVLEPHPSEWLATTGVHLNGGVPDTASVAVLAVKPQTIRDAAPDLISLAKRGTVFISVAAGTPIAEFETIYGADTPIIRVMPNTPASIGRGISALVGSAAVNEDHLVMAERLMQAVGETVRLEQEAQMDAVTGLSGSGPAYVFHLIEALAAAGEAEGLPPDLSMALARATVAGAGELAGASSESAATLRQNVTSPGGTTAAGLSVLMQDLPDLIRRTVAAAAERSRELAG
ncbi:MAG: pyrroline-5-carboxylate reductase [Pseudomonadota bacterium]